MKSKTLMKRYGVLLAAGLMSVPVMSLAAKPSNGKVSNPFEWSGAAPKVVQTTCSACHGLHGISMVPGYPNLAGQWPQYIEKQLRNFKSHKRADPMSSVMWAMAAPLTKKQISDVARYFYNQKPQTPKTTDPAAVAAGRKIWFGGIPSKGVPACYACHGQTGLGLPPKFPRLAGQHQQYVVNQLTYFKKGLRKNDPLGMMRYVAKNLSSAQIKDLAAFVRSE